MCLEAKLSFQLLWIDLLHHHCKKLPLAKLWTSTEMIHKQNNSSKHYSNKTCQQYPQPKCMYSDYHWPNIEPAEKSQRIPYYSKLCKHLAAVWHFSNSLWLDLVRYNCHCLFQHKLEWSRYRSQPKILHVLLSLDF